MTEALPPLREVIARHGIGARRSLGQHFLLDANLARRIVRAAGNLDGQTVVEIGPGPGGLTRALLETGAARVIAVERDPRCIDALSDLAGRYGGRLRVVAGDALETDIAGLAAGGRVAIVANLPYNVATPLLIGWLRRIERIAAMTLMFQKEVAERIAAAPGSAAYGRLTVICQWLCEARRAFDVAPSAFVPPPRVTSSVVRLIPRDAPLAPAGMADLEAVTAAAFGRRRKMLRSALGGLVADPLALLSEAGIEATARAETLPPEAFCAFARALAGIRDPRSAA
ncbi:MAG: 16S rRNA (adenine(1518)-N(6)/adenine(1519)-N(6))-dimethyltransferase RsmA [Defluviicoccus sp.]|nr:16S rRNA (adenine(1518)-N(6)/adenine(1519)-N(6))-dimethyltransferase RsmA [Defluviicoccus sp.]